jgi:branched-chain amino acid transport system permease protein
MASLSELRQRPWVRWAGPLLLVVVLAVLPLLGGEATNDTLSRIGVFAVAVLGLNVVMGYTGQVSLGQIFFLGLGAYVTAYGVQQEWNIVLVFVLACLIPAVVGLVVALAAARLGGLAIAMVTIALPIVGVPLAKRLSDFTGGSQGLSARFVEAPEGSGLFDDQWQLYLVIVIGGLVFLLTRNLVRGKYGRAFAIVKGNENVAASMGISPYRYKVLAFTIASLIGGVSGFLYMVVVQYTSPETMSFGHSIELLVAMVIGGAGSIVGSLLGGAFYVVVPDITNAIDPSLTALLQGALLLVVLFVLPGGLASLPRALTRGFRRSRAPRETAAPQTSPSATAGSGTPAEEPQTERQGHA